MRRLWGVRMAGSGHVHVDLAELRAFARSLLSETQDGFTPHVTTAVSQIQQGVRFGGAFEAGQVRAARPVFALALLQAADNVARQVEAATILIESMQQIVARHTEADDVASRHLAMVENIMSEAVAKARRALEPPPTSPASGGEFE
jgi:DNA-binding response OmpR family regulator